MFGNGVNSLMPADSVQIDDTKTTARAQNEDVELITKAKLLSRDKTNYTQVNEPMQANCFGIVPKNNDQFVTASLNNRTSNAEESSSAAFPR